MDIISERFELEPRIEYHSSSLTETHVSGKLQYDRSGFDFLSDFRTLVGKIYNFFVLDFF